MSVKLGEVGTYDWDTSFAIRYKDANAAITNNWDNVNEDAKIVNNVDEGYSIQNGILGPWQLCEGGDGRNVWMNLTFKSGKFCSPGQDPAQGTDLTNACFQCEINLAFIPDPTKKSNNKLLADPSGDATNVRNVSGINVGDITKSIMKEVFGGWLSKNLNAFNWVFHTLDISEHIDSNSSWKFITPTALSYAVTDSGSIDTSVFGVLTMTNNNKAPANHQVSPNAIPANCNSGFNISGTIFTQEMLLTGAALQFERPEWVTKSTNKDADLHKWISQNFAIANDGMSVQNSKQMKFGTFKDDDGKDRDLYVDASDFKLSVNYGLIEVDFTDLNYEYSPGINVHINYKQHFEVDLVNATDPNNKAIKVFSLKNHDRDCNVSITKSKAVTITEIVTGVCLSIAGAVLGGMAGEAIGGLIKGAGQAAATGAVEGAEGAINATLELTEAGIEAGAKNGITLGTEAAAAAGAEAAGQAGGKMAGFLARIAPKLVGAMVGAGIGTVIASIPEYVVLSAKGSFDQLPTFDIFAEKAMMAHTWPNQAGYTLKNLGLHTSLQIGGDLIWK